MYLQWHYVKGIAKCIAIGTNQVHNATMDINSWLSSLPGAPTPTVAAKQARITPTTLIRHAQRGETTAENVIAIARAYGIAPVDALVELGFLTAEEVVSERLGIRETLKGATIQEKWDSLADDIDGQHLFIGHFPRFSELDARMIGEAHKPKTLESTPDVAAPDYDALIERINSGEEKVTAQEATNS